MATAAVTVQAAGIAQAVPAAVTAWVVPHTVREAAASAVVAVMGAVTVLEEAHM